MLHSLVVSKNLREHINWQCAFNHFTFSLQVFPLSINSKVHYILFLRNGSFLSCACVFFLCVGSHARLRCMCTCNRCTFCLCQNFLNSELVQTVRTKLYTVVFSRFSGWFYLASLLFLYFYISLLNLSLFIHFFFFILISHSFSFISAFLFWPDKLLTIYTPYSHNTIQTVWKCNGAASVMTFCGLSPYFRIGL